MTPTLADKLDFLRAQIAVAQCRAATTDRAMRERYEERATVLRSIESDVLQVQAFDAACRAVEGRAP